MRREEVHITTNNQMVGYFYYAHLVGKKGGSVAEDGCGNSRMWENIQFRSVYIYLSVSRTKIGRGMLQNPRA